MSTIIPNLDIENGYQFIQCSSDYIASKKKEDFNPGELYFVLDTKQILLVSKNRSLVPMGKSTGVRFANQDTNLNDVNPTITFVLDSLQDKSCYPQVDDLIFNETDGCFYRVYNVEDGNIETTRLPLVGSGGGGGGGTIAGEVTSNIAISMSDLKKDNLPLVIVQESGKKYTISNLVQLKVDGVLREKEGVLQTILIDGKEVPGTDKTIRSETDNIITINNEWFEPGSPRHLQVRYNYGTAFRTYSIGYVTSLNLTIDDSDFKKQIETLKTDGVIQYGASVLKSAEGLHKIYIVLKDQEGQVLPNVEQYYKDGTIKKDEYGHYFTIPSNPGFEGKAENVKFSGPQIGQFPYGVYTIETQHVAEYIFEGEKVEKEVYKGIINSYSFISSYNKSDESAPLLYCDFSKIEGQTFTTSSLINIPILLCDPTSDKEYGVVSIVYSTGKNSDTNEVRLNELDKSTYIIKPKIGENQTVKIIYKYNNGNSTIESKECKFTVVQGSNILVSPAVTLSALGHSNTNENVSNWENSIEGIVSDTVTTSLTNFTWTDEGTGWCEDNNNTKVLRVGADAKVTIDGFNPFRHSDDPITKTGMSIAIDFLVKNFTNRTTAENNKDIIISCFGNGNLNFGFNIYGDLIEFVGMADTISLGFQERERMHVVINITPTQTVLVNGSPTQKGMLQIFINGILSALRVYDINSIPTFPKNETFFTIGNKNTCVDIYSINMFKEALEFSDVFKYYLETLENTSSLADIQKKNNIYNPESKTNEVYLDSVVANTGVPVMVITGVLPKEKTDKGKTAHIEFYHPDREQSFSTIDTEDLSKNLVNIEVQGTSSQYFPVKNWKLKKLLKKEGGYSLGGTQIKTQTFCLKADFAESTGYHNTQNANLSEDLYKANNWPLNPAQTLNSKCRTAIYGYPIIVFHRESINDTPEFMGKYNFNFDKGSKEIFGLEDTTTGTPRGECWEFKENDAITGFMVDAFKTIEEGETFGWDKWRVTFTSNVNKNITKQICFPLDSDPDRGFDYIPEGVETASPFRNSNYDYVIYCAEKYLREYSGDDAWWKQATIVYEKIAPMWVTYFEPRYSGKQLFDVYGNVIEYTTDEQLEDGSFAREEVCDITNFAELYDWIMSTAPVDNLSLELYKDSGRTKFKEFQDGITEKFELNRILFYYVYTHFVIASDQRAKNMFFTYWYPMDAEGNVVDKDSPLKAMGGKWEPWLYDNDTTFGINNAGFEAYPYYSEDDGNDGGAVFKGETSVLWNNLKTVFEGQMASVYASLRTPANIGTKENPDMISLDYSTFYRYFIEGAMHKWPIMIYNEDANRKYIKYAFEGVPVPGGKPGETKQEDVTGKARGSGEAYFKRFIPDRISYCDGRWKKADTGNSLLLRPDKNGTFTLKIKVFNTGNYRYLLGANPGAAIDLFNFSGVLNSGEEREAIVSLPNAASNITYFSSPDSILNFGELYKFRPTQFEGGKALKVETLKLGNKDIIIPNVPYTYVNGSFVDDNGNLQNENILYTLTQAIPSSATGIVSSWLNKDKEVNDIILNQTIKTMEEFDIIFNDFKQIGSAFSHIGKTVYYNKNEKTVLTYEQIIEKLKELLSQSSQDIQEIYHLKDWINNSIVKGLNNEEIDKTRSLCATFSISSPSLKVFDFSNVSFKTNVTDATPAKEQLITLTSSPNAREIYGRNSGVTKLVLPNGGYIEKILMSDSLKDFTIQNQMLLTENNVIIENKYISEKNPYRNIINIEIKDCPQFNSRTFLEKCLDYNDDIYEYNLPDDYTDTSVKTIAITNIDYEKNSDWIFADEYEFEHFVLCFEKSMKLNGKKGNDVINKVYLQGRCFIEGEVQGSLKDRLWKYVAEDFEILSDASKTTQTVNFYYIHPDPSKNGEDGRIPIKILGDNGELIPYTQTVQEGECISDPYGDSRLTNSSIPEDPYEGKTYIHNPGQSGGWMITEKDVIPTELVDNGATGVPIFKGQDVYAVFTSEDIYYYIEFWNENRRKGLVENILHGTSYQDPLPDMDIVFDQPGKNKDDYQFNNKWSPDPRQILTSNLKCEPVFDYIAYKTFRVLEREIEQLETNATSIGAYTFAYCTKLKEISLTHKGGVRLEDDTAFEGTPIGNLDPEAKIRVPKVAYNSFYKTNAKWSKYLDIMIQEE